MDLEAIKRCSHCRETKPYDDYYKDKNYRTGLSPQCKSCHDKGVKLWREANPEKRKAIDKAAKNRTSVKQKREWSRRYVTEHRGECAARLRKYRSDNPERARANEAIKRAVKSGRINRPVTCQKCGVSGKIEGHHPDYSKPLEVKWLCTKCHRREDRAA